MDKYVQMWRKSMELRAQKEFLQPIEALQSSPNGLKIFGNVPDVQQKASSKVWSKVKQSRALKVAVVNNLSVHA
ncbi:hypothetical protein Bhyg_08210, partial [Pseudolycoriella hygida]